MLRLFHRQIDGVAPTFVKKPAIRQEDDGKRLLFECRIKADPKPSVTWSHNAAVVQESKRHKVINKYTHYYFFLFSSFHFVFKKCISRPFQVIH